MPGNSFGRTFRITTFGESHGGAVGVIVDGCPPGLNLSEGDIQPELDRRKPGQSSITTPRKEEDVIQIMSGVFNGETTGTPIMILARNRDTRSEDYEHMKRVFRPGHADFTYQQKYGRRDWRGSGRASARETLARVAAGAIAKKWLSEKLGISILSWVEQVGNIQASVVTEKVTLEAVEATIVRCPDPKAAAEMISLIQSVRDSGDSVGGIIKGRATGVPVGLGEPVFDKLHADLGKALLSINAVKGFDIGSGFFGATLRGSDHNDRFYVDPATGIRTRTNNAGGVLGGISSGEDLIFRVAFKPVSTINIEQETVDIEQRSVTLKGTGRHDPCVLPRAVPIVDAMTALVLIDHVLRSDSYART